MCLWACGCVGMVGLQTSLVRRVSSATMPGRSWQKQCSMRRKERVSPVIATLKRSALSKPTAMSAAAKKLIKRRPLPQRLHVTDGVELEGTRLLNVSVLLDAITEHSSCAKCRTRSLRAVERLNTRCGLVTDLS